MSPIIILGAGKIGETIAKFLHASGDYDVCIADNDAARLTRLSESVSVETITLDVTDEAALLKALAGRERVISACSFYVNPGIARAALKVGASYFDLTEDIATAHSVRECSKQAKPGQVFMPQCGLAPGFISILAYDLTTRFDELDTVKMRVGALPKYPSNEMMYNLTWSTDGLINEYCNPCEAILEGKKVDVLPLEGLGKFSLDGKEYEAFNTSGGLGTLCETLKGKVNELTYKTVRYKGHRYLMNFLIKGLNLGVLERRNLLREILESSVPITRQDVVLIFVTVSGKKNGQLTQVSDARKIYHETIAGEHYSSIQITTAAAMCAVVDLHAEGQLPEQGFVRQEQIKLDQFMANRFGRYYIPKKRRLTDDE